MAEIRLEQVNKRFKKHWVVRDFTLTVADREFVVLVGPSGCGKSTTLRMIAGLEEVTSGEISIAGRVVNQVPPKDRDIAMVFQSYALYPHMNVYKNMAFGLMNRGVPKDEINQRVKRAAEILGISDLLHRRPAQLSGGQRQRVAMGRAIVRDPQAFLFDEPLSNLDAKLRVQMRAELAKLHERLQSTIVYVTHDQIEAMTLAHRIVVMKDGKIMQVGRPLEVYERPANRFVAGFIGSPSMNFLNVRIAREGEDLWVDGQSFRLKIPRHRASAYRDHVDREVIFGIRPEDIKERTRDDLPEGVEPLRAEVDVREPIGSEVIVTAAVGGHSFTARVSPSMQVRVHEPIDLAVNMNKMHLFEPETGTALNGD
ncbi:carbohydrate ABC transporter ATP-binding protein, CUT1 family (TC 3.A.1.1.-) [Desulfacinum hydrothermale DSM 13146]|uniref:Carbohydrate ABC transporter ATP-binding protein, CUT1 family (TC 3.A.1.1.-) n=1 Tax=Desulfacinum hydrothermale DSM 13146 TaxID=1121390 RepID=A0A1W1XGG7_9BACT|nr:sn-glycerol-3-phosphate ABC transporter ATP-binding protein UgpC [Desulfacinum hydrothermale]SMC23096.1 carbohydrate ABC transporter ATP-binding protein, CUT1 family (TC 3.A.1.1.-) [Desulfacinum hydrothermale DSM 13146]